MKWMVLPSLQGNTRFLCAGVVFFFPRRTPRLKFPQTRIQILRFVAFFHLPILRKQSVTNYWTEADKGGERDEISRVPFCRKLD